MSNEATARPWRLATEEIDRPCIQGDLNPASNDGLPCYQIATIGFCHVRWSEFSPDTRERLKADAQLIVTAVNEYDELLAEVGRLREALEELADKAERASLVQDRSVGIIKQALRYIAKEARATLSGKKEGKGNANK